MEGIKTTESIHWINAYGLVDSDDRTEEQIEALSVKGIVAIPFYSVEALYYHLHIIERIAIKISEITGEETITLFKKATENIIQDISQHKERLCSRLCEKRMRNNVMSSLPKYKDIQDRGEFKLTFNLDSILQTEENNFDRLVAENNVIELLARYPIRETQVLKRIVAGLGLTREQYESSVRQLIINDNAVRDFYKALLQELTNLLEKK